MLFRNAHPVRRYLCLLLGVALLLCGCARDGSAPKTEANDPPGTTTPTPPQDPLAVVMQRTLVLQKILFSEQLL